jgi:RNA polymerase sigma factor (TIGR02999 family)
LLPLVYDELRRLAAARMAGERPDHTLQATALVHEAYLRLVDVNHDHNQNWNSRGHFFSAAAEAMRRILIESATRKRSIKRGGDRTRLPLDDDLAATGLSIGDDLFEFNELLDQLAAHDPDAAELIKLRLFAGLRVEEAGAVLGMSRSDAYENWKYARAWFASQHDETHK